MSGAIAVISFGVLLAGYGALMRFATRGQTELSPYASAALGFARIVIPLGFVIAALGVVILAVALAAG